MAARTAPTSATARATLSSHFSAVTTIEITLSTTTMATIATIHCIGYRPFPGCLRRYVPITAPHHADNPRLGPVVPHTANRANAPAACPAARRDGPVRGDAAGR